MVTTRHVLDVGVLPLLPLFLHLLALPLSVLPLAFFSRFLPYKGRILGDLVLGFFASVGSVLRFFFCFSCLRSCISALLA